MSDNAYILSSLASNPHFNGQGLTYEIAGELELPAQRIVIENAEFKQIAAAPNVATRTLWRSGGPPITLANVKIDRGADKLAGKMGSGYADTSAGLWLYAVPEAKLDVEVTGNGRGTGIYIQDCPNLDSHNRLHVHDMVFEHSGSTAGMTEQLIGIWCNYFDAAWNSRFRLNAPRVKNITSRINGVDRAHQTDGITVGGAFGVCIDRPEIENCGEGIDFTGSRGNTSIEVSGGYIYNCDAFGVKLACTARYADIHDMQIWNAGFSGVVISGPVNMADPLPTEIVVHHVIAMNTGMNGHWTGNVAGFAILNGAGAGADWPRHVVFESCLTHDAQDVKTMKYGYRNEPGQSGQQNHLTNRMINCRSVGHSVAERLGVFG